MTKVGKLGVIARIAALGFDELPETFNAMEEGGPSPLRPRVALDVPVFVNLKDNAQQSRHNIRGTASRQNQYLIFTPRDQQSDGQRSPILPMHTASRKLLPIWLISA